MSFIINVSKNDFTFNQIHIISDALCYYDNFIQKVYMI